MRFMIARKADRDTEAGAAPSQELLTAMMQYNEELVSAGVMLAGDGLKPSSQGVRIKFSGGKLSVIDGPFAETKELIAGFTMIQVGSREEAIEWVKRWPPLDGNGEVELELRPLYESEDFGPEVAEAEDRLRAQVAEQTRSVPPAPGPLTPYLTVDDARAAIDFYVRAFGARELSRQATPDGTKLIHAALDINGAQLMLSDDFPEMTGGSTPRVLGGSPVTLHLNLPDVDTVFQRAIDAGATVTMPLADQFWGDRYGQLRDPFGHSWSLATRKKAPTQAELDRGAEQFGKD